MELSHTHTNSALQPHLARHLQGFDQDRAKTDRKSTSRLSPHIHYGASVLWAWAAGADAAGLALLGLHTGGWAAILRHREAVM